MVLWLFHQCNTSVPASVEARAVYGTVKGLSCTMGSRHFFLVNQSLDSYWSKICGVAQLVFTLFTRLAQRSTGGNPLFVQFRYIASHSIVRVNEGDFMCLFFYVGWRPTLHIIFCGFGAITSSTQENLQACVHWSQDVNLNWDNSFGAVPHLVWKWANFWLSHSPLT